MATLQQQPHLLNATEPLTGSVPHLTPTSTSVLAAIVAVAVLYALTGKRRSKAKLPPGPPGLPVVGNILDIPKSRPWVKFAEWTDKYGELRVSSFESCIAKANPGYGRPQARCTRSNSAGPTCS